MTAMELLEKIAVVKDEYVAEAHGEDLAVGNRIQYMKRPIPMKKSLLVALVAVLLLMLAGFAYAVITLQDLKLGGDTDQRQDSVNSSDVLNTVSDVISMQGVSGSPEYQAAEEWKSYRDSYDPEGVIVQSIGNNPTNVDEKYSLYQVYTQEMCDKLEEIAGKYGLKLHVELNAVDEEELDYRVGGAFMAEFFSRGWAYIYDDGSFQFDGEAAMEGKSISFQLRRAVKGTLDEVVLNVGSVEEYEEFSYKTASGETVLLALGSHKALIYADFEDCFILMNVLTGTGEGMTVDDLKSMADGIDFTLLKNVILPDMRGDSVLETGDSSDGAGQLSGGDSSGQQVTGREAMLLAYRTVLEDVYENQTFPGGRDLGYDGFDISLNKFALVDIDRDGREELILSYTTTYMAGMAEIIYDYDPASGVLQDVFVEFPNLEYYDNGIILAGWSHNQGLAGEDFWAYTLYQYNPVTDLYLPAGMVDAWDKTVAEKDYEGKAFPEEIDVDGDGMVYYIMPDGEYNFNDPVDGAEYRQWLTSYVGEARTYNIDYQDLNKENIDNLK